MMDFQCLSYLLGFKGSLLASTFQPMSCRLIIAENNAKHVKQSNL